MFWVSFFGRLRNCCYQCFILRAVISFGSVGWKKYKTVASLNCLGGLSVSLFPLLFILLNRLILSKIFNEPLLWKQSLITKGMKVEEKYTLKLLGQLLYVTKVERRTQTSKESNLWRLPTNKTKPSNGVRMNGARLSQKTRLEMAIFYWHALKIKYGLFD